MRNIRTYYKLLLSQINREDNVLGLLDLHLHKTDLVLYAVRCKKVLSSTKDIAQEYILKRVLAVVSE